MAIKEDLTTKVREFVCETWPEIPNAIEIPTVDDLAFGNNGKNIDVTILYADIADSTKLVDEVTNTRAAEYYKAFLHCASQLIKRNNGAIQAYDGDRVMAAFIGDNQADNAVGAALELHYAVSEIINPEFNSVYTQTQRTLQFTVGIDSGTCLVVKVGVRAVGELAWIGGAANYAAKLNSFEGLDHTYPIRVTQQTYARLIAQSLYGSRGDLMWDGPYSNLKSRVHYRTNYSRSLP
jgi:class 3 adenylate cyclase